MRIGGTNGVNNAQKIYAKMLRHAEEQGPAQPPQGDRVEISDAARFSEAMARLPDVRAEKVAQAKALISGGQLDTPENMDLALDRMIDDLLGDAPAP
jgi:hypothetical protein